MKRGTMLVLSLLVVLGAAACRSARPPAAPEAPPPGTVRVEGLLTSDGVECPSMRGTDGRLYTLVGDLRGFKTGDHVVVEATVAEVSFCMQGTTLEVKSIRRR